MSVHLATVTFDASSLLPEDAYVNTFHFDGSGTDFANIGDMLEDLYMNVPTAGGVAPKTYMADEAYGPNMTIRVYDLSDPMPRIPLYQSVRAMTGLGSGDQLPAEVSICLTFQGAPESGVPQARRRNRIYWPPLTATADTVGRPATTFRTQLCRAASDLLDAAQASVSWTWVAYSPTTETFTPVVNGWVDDAWDTQRRRGLSPTTRTLWS